MKKSAAFTLVELLIVIGITATLSVVGIGFYVNQQKAKILENTTQEIANYLHYAQQKSMAQEQGLQWGVHFENPASGSDFYALYTGATYTTPIETKYLPAGIEFQAPASGASIDASYAKLTGFLSGSSYQQIILVNTSGLTKNILTCQQGFISYNAEISVCGGIDTTPPVVSSVTASNTSYSSYVDSPFDLSANINETQGGVSSCEYTINNGTNWYSANFSGTGPDYTCSKTNITSAGGSSLTLNTRATSKGGTSSGSQIARTVDASAPTASDNWTDNWTATSPVNVTISSNDTGGSGLASTKYCIDTPNTCYPSTSYSSPVVVSCASGSTCTQYARYAAWDNVNNASSVYSKTVRQDKQNPTASDNWTDNWTATSPVTVTITPSDGSGSGIQTTYYCVDTVNTCTPTTVGTAPSVTCTAGSTCTQYVRYYTKDNVNNTSSTYSKRVRQDLQAPTDGTLTATPGNAQVSLSWTVASDSGSGLATSNTYKLVYSTSSSPAINCTSGTQIYTGTSTSYLHTDLTNDITYYYRVCAYDAVSNISTGATASGVPSAWLPGFDNRIKLTIDYTKIDADLSYFPVTVILSSTHGAGVFSKLGADANRFKIAFTKSDGTTQLYGEIERFDYANSKAVFHVSANGWNISSSANTDFYLYYDPDHADNTAYIGDINSTPGANVWDSNFKAVYHMKDNTTSTILDSTSNSKDGTKSSANNPLQSTAGKIAYAQDFSSDKITLPQVFTTNNTHLTLEVVAESDTTVSRYIFYQLAGATRMLLQLTDGDTMQFYYGADAAVTIVPTISFATWYYVVGRGDGTNLKIFQNYLTTATGAGTGCAFSANSSILGDIGDGTRYWDGLMDELRFSETDRSDAWIKATYNSLYDTLLTYGSEETHP